ncbi:Formate hydrogenlyase subunit 4 [bacterium HR40]|nr:Formate hydrogenlyase subunit 4 [bacterium HR40]
MAGLIDIFAQGLEMLLVVGLAPLLVGWVRKVKAHVFRRRGPSLLQPYRDLLRLFSKDALLAENASWISRTAPYVVFAAVWVAAALIPTFAAGLVFHWAADLIAIVGLFGLARFALAVAGMDVGTSFGGIGSSREMLLASLAEPAMLMVVFTISLFAGSSQLASIVDFVLAGGIGIRPSLGLALVAVAIVAIAENARIPVDNPATHLELTMVHEAMVFEYSGRHLAMIEAAAAVKLLAWLSLIAAIFLPFGMAPGPHSGFGAMAVGLLAWLAKLAVLATLLGLFEASIAKMRVFRVPEFLGGAFALGVLATVLLFVSRGL